MEEEEIVYKVQTGAFREPENAEGLLYQLQQQGFPAYTVEEEGLYKVLVGAFRKAGQCSTDGDSTQKVWIQHLYYNLVNSSVKALASRCCL